MLHSIRGRASLATFGRGSCTRKGFRQLKLQETPIDTVLQWPSGGALLRRHCESLQNLNQSTALHGGNGGTLRQQVAMQTRVNSSSCTTDLVHLLEAGPYPAPASSMLSCPCSQTLRMINDEAKPASSPPKRAPMSQATHGNKGVSQLRSRGLV